MSGQSIINFLGKNTKQYDLIAIDFIDDVFLKNNKKTENLVELVNKNISEEGSVWLTCNNFLDVKYNRFIPFRLQKLFSKNNFYLKNIICWVSENSHNEYFNDYYK